MDDPLIQQAVAGDRLVIPISTGKIFEADALMKTLKEKGVEVEFRHEKRSLNIQSAISNNNNNTVDSFTNPSVTRFYFIINL